MTRNFAHGLTHSPVRLAAALLLTLAIAGGAVATNGLVAAGAMASPVHLTDGAPWQGTIPSSPILVSVHNAGDTPQSAQRAINAGPSMIEVDVSWTGDQLVIAHNLRPDPLPQDLTTLADGWSRTDGAANVLIDVKPSSQASLDRLVGFLQTHRDRPIYLSTPDPAALAYLHERAPWTHSLLSLTNQAQLDGLVRNGQPFNGLAGVSAKASLLTQSNVAAIRGRGLDILAYSVNDMGRVNILAEWGVSGITTDNLTVVRALSANRVPSIV